MVCKSFFKELAISYNSTTFGNWAAAGSNITDYFDKAKTNSFSDADNNTMYYDYISFSAVAISGPVINTACLYFLTNGLANPE